MEVNRESSQVTEIQPVNIFQFVSLVSVPM